MELKIQTRHYREVTFLIDDEDYQKIKDCPLTAQRDSGKKSFRLMTGKRTVARIIMDCHPKLRVLFLDGDTQKLEKSNLKVCTKEELARYAVKKYPNASSKYRGVCWNKQSRKWSAQIRVDKKQIKLGLFEDEEAAAKTYNLAAIKYHREFARLNNII